MQGPGKESFSHSNIPTKFQEYHSQHSSGPPTLGTAGREERGLGPRDGFGTRVPETPEGETEALGYGRLLRNSLPERGVLRGREETLRNTPTSCFTDQNSCSRRNRLWT